MKLSLKTSLKAMIVTTALGLASASAFAVTVVPPGPYPDQTPLPSTGNGGLVFTLFSTDTTNTPFSFDYYLGLSLNDVLPNSSTGLLNPGTTLTWTIPGLTGNTALSGVNPSTLLYHVTATSTGSTNVVNSLKVATTVNLAASPTPTTTAGALNAAANNNNTFLLNGNSLAGNPDTVTNPLDPTFAPNTYGAGLNAVTFSAAGAPGTSLAFFFGTNPARGATSAGSLTQYQASDGTPGLWTFNLATDTLTYSVASTAPPVPLPAAIWLLGSGILGLLGVSRRRSIGASAATA